MSESQLVTSIVRTLESLGYWAWRVNSGMVRTEHRLIKLAPSGTPDILGVLKDGKLFGIEAKIEKGKQSESQKLWQEKAESYGVKYAVCRTLNDAVSKVREWQHAIDNGQ
jgi:hypothetical protein